MSPPPPISPESDAPICRPRHPARHGRRGPAKPCSTCRTRCRVFARIRIGNPTQGYRSQRLGRIGHFQHLAKRPLYPGASRSIHCAVAEPTARTPCRHRYRARCRPAGRPGSSPALEKYPGRAEPVEPAVGDERRLVHIARNHHQRKAGSARSIAPVRRRRKSRLPPQLVGGIRRAALVMDPDPSLQPLGTRRSRSWFSIRRFHQRPVPPRADGGEGCLQAQNCRHRRRCRVRASRPPSAISSRLPGCVRQRSVIAGRAPERRG